MRAFSLAFLFAVQTVFALAATSLSIADQDKGTPTEIRSPPLGSGSSVVRISAEQIAAQEIAIAKAGRGTIARRLRALGSIMPAANRIARVPVRVVGTVAEMRKQLGDRVAKAEIVAVLDSREAADAKSEYLTASVNADLQKINYDRAAALLSKRVSPEAQYLQVRATYLEAQLRLELARQKLSALGLDAREVAAAAKREETEGTPASLRSYELRAPLAGRIIERKVDVGTAVGKEGDPADVYMIADLSVVWADLAVPTKDIDQVTEGARVSLLSNTGDTAQSGEGRVIFVSPVLNTDTHSVRVIAEIANKNGTWRPGTYVTAEIEVERNAVPVMIPRTAVQTIDGRAAVFVRTPEGFERREIRLGREDDEYVEITAGLAAGTEIAVKNSFLLKAELGKADAGDSD